MTVLGPGNGSQCGKCRVDTANGLMVSNTLPLTSALLQDISEGLLTGLEPVDVVPHLRPNLKWNVTLFTSAQRAVAGAPDFRISVASTRVTIGADKLPIHSGEYEVHPELTHGKPAVMCPGEDA